MPFRSVQQRLCMPLWDDHESITTILGADSQLFLQMRFRRLGPAAQSGHPAPALGGRGWRRADAPRGPAAGWTQSPPASQRTRPSCGLHTDKSQVSAQKAISSASIKFRHADMQTCRTWVSLVGVLRGLASFGSIQQHKGLLHFRSTEHTGVHQR